jgi:hypothetical protein
MLKKKNFRKSGIFFFKSGKDLAKKLNPDESHLCTCDLPKYNFPSCSEVSKHTFPNKCAWPTLNLVQKSFSNLDETTGGRSDESVMLLNWLSHAIWLSVTAITPETFFFIFRDTNLCVSVIVISHRCCGIHANTCQIIPWTSESPLSIGCPHSGGR